jgi:alpha-beta hydrolase superfamily lysophospholipase
VGPRPLIPSRRHAITLALYGLALVAVVGGRGWVLARALGGRYPLSYLAFDVAGLGAIIATLRLFDAALKRLARRVVGETTAARRVIGQAVHAIILLGVGFPFLLATLVFHPLRIASVGTPRTWGLAYADVTLVSEGRRLAAWHLPAPQPGRPAVLIAHGFNANKENFLPAAVLVHRLGYEVLIFDFRAHGDSEGHTTTFGLGEARDVKAAHDWLRRDDEDRPIYALGYSMGGSAVIHAAAEYGIFDRIVLDSTFSSLESVARATLLWYFGPLATPLWDLGRFWGWTWSGLDVGRHRPGERIRALTNRPLLLIHGTADRLVPHAETLRLYELAGRRAELWPVAGVDHVQSLDHPEYPDRLRRFFGGG